MPYLKPEYFQETPERILFEEIQSHVVKYNNLPTIDELGIAVSGRDSVFDSDFKAIGGLIEEIAKDKSDTNQAWLIDETEKFCKEQALYNAMSESLLIMDGKDKKQTKTKGAIPQLISEALAVSFDPNVGHDYFVDIENRFEFYHQKHKRLPFDLKYLNLITGGGLTSKTLTIIMGGTNVGKTMIMCHFAASFLMQQKNVLYITLEMSERKIAQRIDANMLDVTLDDLLMLSKENFIKRMEKVRDKAKGKLVIKEYPTASASATNFRNLLNELQLKKQFKPDVIFVDYLNICTSARIRMGNNVGSYTLVKSIAEELRGLAVEFDLPLISGTQTTRSGYTSSDPGLEDTSESFGLPATADLFLVAVVNEELERMNQMMFKQLKNRDNDVNKHKKFIVGMNRNKMKLFDAPEKAQTLVNDVQERDEQPSDEALNRFGTTGGYDKYKF